jgi:tetratricopeptide (TPR) repeat protein
MAARAPGAQAAFRDADTLAREAARWPAIAEVVLGRIPSRSRLYHEKQVAYTTPLLGRAEAAPARFDDVAAALRRLGRIDEALATLRRKAERLGEDPATSAELAALHVRAGDLREARARLEAAIARAQGPAAEPLRLELAVVAYRERLARDAELARREDLLGSKPVSADEPVGDSAEALARAEALAALARARWDDDPHVWFALGRALAHGGANRLALRAFDRARALGHPLAEPELCETAKRFKEYAARGFYCPRVLDAVARDARAAAAAAARTSARDDARLRSGRKAQVFGY